MSEAPLRPSYRDRRRVGPFRKGGTDAFASADLTQAALAALAPPGGSASGRATSRTVPSDWKVTVAWRGGAPGARQARAPGRTAPKAPWTAPIEGRRGTLQGPEPRLDPGAMAAAGTSDSSAPAAAALPADEGWAAPGDPPVGRPARTIRGPAAGGAGGD